MGAVPQAGVVGMKALWAIAAYEVRSEMRRISTWVYFGLLFALTFVMMAAMAGTWPDFDLGSRVQLANAPRPLANLIAVISILAVPITSALAGRAVHRDFETRIHPLFFTTPVGKTAYLGGRYLGTVIVNLLVFLGIPLGAMIAAAMPFTDADRIGPFRLDAYAAPFALIVIPNVLLTAALVGFMLGDLREKLEPLGIPHDHVTVLLHEVPRDNSGGRRKIQPIATHGKRITDFASWRGLLVLTGVA